MRRYVIAFSIGWTVSNFLWALLTDHNYYSATEHTYWGIAAVLTFWWINHKQLRGA